MLFSIFSALLCAQAVITVSDNISRSPKNVSQQVRNDRVFSLFELVSFSNTVCVGSSSATNGTCYTTEECTAKGGSASGNCANGFGVCCIFTPACGSTTNENITYLSQSSSSSVTTPCTYTICTTDSSVCRIKLDFRTFNIAGPQVGTTLAPTVTAPSTEGVAIGDCISDTFTLRSPTGTAVPVICGFNTGQHMIVDATHPSCITAEFVLRSGGSSTKEWDIEVTQYTCAEAHELVGSAGSQCLQYHSGISGSIASFNWPATTKTDTTTHLSNQDYNICIRQEKGYCGICYAPAIATPFTASTFGLGVSSADDDTTSVTECTSDYLVIPNAAAAPFTFGTAPTVNNFCGRFLAAVTISATMPAAADHTTASVCTSTSPFSVRVHFDDTEITTMSNIADMAKDSEVQRPPGGIIGFKINYIQQSC